MSEKLKKTAFSDLHYLWIAKQYKQYVARKYF